jgi:hypothetical protein
VLAAQGRQVCVLESQVGVAPVQVALVTQATQVPEETLHTGVAPSQRLVFVAEQAPQAPPGWQAGVPPLHSPSPAQPRQVCVPVSHIGRVPPHWAAVEQTEQVPVATSQVDGEPVQSVLLLAEQTPQAPPG